MALMENIMEAVTDKPVRRRIGDNNPPPGPLPGEVGVEPTIERVTVRVLPDGRMTRRDAARYLGIAVKTLAMWDLENPAKLGGIKVGGRRFYYKERLDAVICGDAR